MHQLSFLSADNRNRSTLSEWVLYIDGAARNNPGPAGAGFFITHNNSALCKEGYYLGRKTNNQAEYCALLLGLHYLKSQLPAGQAITVLSDSLLLVRQMNSIYKVRHPKIIPLHKVATRLREHFVATFNHIPRERNTEADKAANMGIDKQIPLPSTFVDMLHSHEVSL